MDTEKKETYMKAQGWYPPSVLTSITGGASTYIMQSYVEANRNNVESGTSHR